MARIPHAFYPRLHAFTPDLTGFGPVSRAPPFITAAAGHTASALRTLRPPAMVHFYCPSLLDGRVGKLDEHGSKLLEQTDGFSISGATFTVSGCLPFCAQAHLSAILKSTPPAHSPRLARAPYPSNVVAPLPRDRCARKTLPVTRRTSTAPPTPRYAHPFSLLALLRACIHIYLACSGRDSYMPLLPRTHARTCAARAPKTLPLPPHCACALRLPHTAFPPYTPPPAAHRRGAPPSCPYLYTLLRLRTHCAAVASHLTYSTYAAQPYLPISDILPPACRAPLLPALDGLRGRKKDSHT